MPSTNDRARELAFAGAPHGTLVTTAEQTAGRGRQGRRWEAPAGSALLMSLVLRDPPAPLPLLAAVAVCDIAGPQARVKWPNDILVPRANDTTAMAKLAGILTESRPQENWAVLGIGVNVAVRLSDLSPELRQTAATLDLLHPRAVEDVLAALLAALQQRLSDPVETTLNAWREHDALRGREIVWIDGTGTQTDKRRSGRAAGIDAAGGLLVALPTGEHVTLQAGEVHLRAAC
jgi:BirA family biotin operon repressor/biotin-[acetyl-CoA-carboxylase] ligase